MATHAPIMGAPLRAPLTAPDLMALHGTLTETLDGITAVLGSIYDGLGDMPPDNVPHREAWNRAVSLAALGLRECERAEAAVEAVELASHRLPEGR